VYCLRFSEEPRDISMNTLPSLPTDIVLSVIQHTEAESSLSLIYVGVEQFKGNYAALTLVLVADVQNSV